MFGGSTAHRCRTPFRVEALGVRRCRLSETGAFIAIRSQNLMIDILRRYGSECAILLAIAVVMGGAWLGATSIKTGTQDHAVRRNEAPSAIKGDRALTTVSMPGLIIEIDSRESAAHTKTPWSGAFDRRSEDADDGDRRDVFWLHPHDVPYTLAMPAFDASIVRPQHSRPEVGLEKRASPVAPHAVFVRWPTHVSRLREDARNWRIDAFRGN